MKATDVRPTRFAEAQRAAHQLIAAAGRGAEVMVIEAGGHPVIRVPFTRDVERAHSAISAMEAQVVRWTLRTETRQDTTVTVERRDERGLVTVDAIDAQGEFINFLEA